MKWLVVLLGGLWSFPLQAAMPSHWMPYLGFEIQSMRMPAVQDWKPVLVQSYSNAQFSLGAVFKNKWGVECGYYTSQRRQKPYTLVANKSFFNNPLASNINTTAYQRTFGAYLDIHKFFPSRIPDIHILISLGAAQVKPSLSILAVGTDPIAATLNNVAGKSRTLLRAGLGAEADLSEWIKLRGWLRLDNSRTLRIQTDMAAPIPNAPFNYSFTAGLGVVVGF